MIHPRCRRLILAMQCYARARRANQWMDYAEDPQHPHEDLIDPLCDALKLEFPESRARRTFDTCTPAASSSRPRKDRMSRVNPRRVLPASVLKGEQCVAPADTFARLSPYNSPIDPTPPEGSEPLIQLIEQAKVWIRRSEQKTKGPDAVRIRPVSIGSDARLQHQWHARCDCRSGILHPAIRRLSNVIDAIDL